MIKKLPFILLLILLSVSGAFGMDSANILLAQVDTSRMLAMNPAFLGMIGSGEVSSCPSYYASAVLSMDFDHDDNTLTACNTAGDAVLFTDSGSDISTYGEGGSNAMKCDDANEYITYTQSANQYGNPKGAAQTLCAKVLFSAFPDNQATIVTIRDGSLVDWVGINYTNQGDAVRVVGYFYTTGGPDQTAMGDLVDETTWEVIGYSYDQPTGEDHKTNPGDQDPWINGWEEDANELTGAMTNDSTIIRIGTQANDPGDVEYYYIDEWAIFDGYGVNCDNYMNP